MAVHGYTVLAATTGLVTGAAHLGVYAVWTANINHTLALAVVTVVVHLHSCALVCTGRGLAVPVALLYDALHLASVLIGAVSAGYALAALGLSHTYLVCVGLFIKRCKVALVSGC